MTRLRRRRLRTEDPRKWSRLFRSGFDYLGELGTTFKFNWHDNEAAMAEAREAWRQHGAGYLALLPEDSKSPWALRIFGAPQSLSLAINRDGEV